MALSGAPEEEITYFRDRLDKRLIKIPYQGHSKTTANMNLQDKKNWEEQDIIIMEDEVESLKLRVLALDTQLDEQVSEYFIYKRKNLMKQLLKVLKKIGLNNRILIKSKENMIMKKWRFCKRN